jgi:hypothetical protein
MFQTLQRWPLTLVPVLLILLARVAAAQVPVFLVGSAGGAFDVGERDPMGGGGLAFQTGLGLRFNRVALGGEFGQHALGAARKARQYGAFLRLAATAGRRVEPYLVLGVAVYRFSFGTGSGPRSLGAGVGPGVTFVLLDPAMRVLLEGRFHSSLDRLGTIASQEFVSVVLGLELRP